MEQAVTHLKEELGGVRTGRATPAVLNRVTVEYYGSPVPLNQLASHHRPRAPPARRHRSTRTRLGASRRRSSRATWASRPPTTASVIRLAFPPLTEERRKDLVKQVHARAEEGRVAVRNVRRHAKEELEKLERGGDISEDDLERAREGAPEADRPVRGRDRRDPGPQGAGAHGGLVSGRQARRRRSVRGPRQVLRAHQGRRLGRARGAGRRTPSEEHVSVRTEQAPARRPAAGRARGRTPSQRASEGPRGRGQLVRHQAARRDRRDLDEPDPRVVTLGGGGRARGAASPTSRSRTCSGRGDAGRPPGVGASRQRDLRRGPVVVRAPSEEDLEAAAEHFAGSIGRTTPTRPSPSTCSPAKAAAAAIS